MVLTVSSRLLSADGEVLITVPLHYEQPLSLRKYIKQ